MSDTGVTRVSDVRAGGHANGLTRGSHGMDYAAAVLSASAICTLSGPAGQRRSMSNDSGTPDASSRIARQGEASGPP